MDEIKKSDQIALLQACQVFTDTGKWKGLFSYPNCGWDLVQAGVVTADKKVTLAGRAALWFLGKGEDPIPHSNSFYEMSIPLLNYRKQTHMSSLSRKLKRHGIRKGEDVSPVKEKLFAVAIKRGDQIWDGGRGGHWKLRCMLDPNLDSLDATKTVPGDIDGFIVAPSGRFVDREEAYEIGVAARQVMPGMKRQLLSSDITWEPHHGN